MLFSVDHYCGCTLPAARRAEREAHGVTFSQSFMNDLAGVKPDIVGAIGGRDEPVTLGRIVPFADATVSNEDRCSHVKATPNRRLHVTFRVQRRGLPAWRFRPH